jgi:hypothetical protein
LVFAPAMTNRRLVIPHRPATEFIRDTGHAATDALALMH